MSYAVPIWDHPAVPITGSDQLFPVRRIHCVAKNYAEHAREMGSDPDREKPFFFAKSPHCLVCGEGELQVPYPLASENLHHELELVVAIGEGGSIFGYGVGIDFTRRDLQHLAKTNGRPWDVAKSFTGAAPMAAIQPASKIGHPRKGRIELYVNDELRQQGDLGDMIYNVEEIIDHLNGYDPLLPGDLIFTGTPAGVGAVVIGDRLRGTIAGVGDIALKIVARS